MSKTTDPDVQNEGVIESVSGPVVTATDLDAQMNDVVRVGDAELMGEVIEIEGNLTTIQVYEETSGIAPAEPVVTTGAPLSVDLGPGMLDAIYDGVQRPLRELQEQMEGAFLERGVDAPGIDMDRTWEFTPEVEPGEEVGPTDIVGTVPETQSIEHKVMVPPDSEGGTVTDTRAGKFTVEETVVELDTGEEIQMHQEWPVRTQRPAEEKETPTTPLISGQRVLDGLFPIAKGGTAAIPGPFGSGKCVTPDTPVMLSDGELVEIEALFERLAGERAAEDGEVLAEADAELMTFDEEAGDIRPAPISHVYRGSTERLVRVTTASGRELEVTPAHKLFRMGGDLQVEETPAADLDVGDSLVMPRHVDVNVSQTTLNPYELLPSTRAIEDSVVEPIQAAVEEMARPRKALAEAVGVSHDVFRNYIAGRTNPPLWVVDELCTELDLDRPAVERVEPGTGGKPVTVPAGVDERFAELLGLVLSDGTLTENSVRFHNTDPVLRERFAGLAAALFDVDSAETVHDTGETLEIRSSPLSSLLAALGVPETGKSVTGAVPEAVLSGPDAVAAAFLRGYYLGNGSFSDGTAEISTASEEMATGLTYLLGRLGVLFRIRRHEDEHRVTISGADELAGLSEALADRPEPEGGTHEKLAAIAEYATTTEENTSVDTVPVGAETMLEIAETARYAEFADEGLDTHTDTGLGEQPSREAFETIGDMIADGGQAVADRVDHVAGMLSDVFFDSIVDIELVEGEQTVYDVTVPETQNFVGGHVPSVLHNTVTQHQLAKWADADIVVYVGCGERGNEMTEVIDDFPELEDPVTGYPLMSRTCLIANTSNMPVAARESCVYTGITIAEYFRDMGYDVALMADSTSRWAEAMREISARLEEMPGEEGYPAYLAARLSEFYERAGYFRNTNGTTGSVSVIGAVSPPGGDFSEPVTQNTLRIVKCFWALDSDLAERRHFPSINWNESYSLYRDQLDPYFEENVSEEFPEQRQWAIDTLDEEAELQEIVQLVGKDALPEDQQLVLEVARYLKEAWLQQDAFDDTDTYCEPEKTYRILKVIKLFNDEAFDALDAGVPIDEITEIDAAPRLTRIRFEDEYNSYIDDLEESLATQIRELY